MNYTEDDMRWIELSTCTSYAGLGLSHSNQTLINKLCKL